MGHRSDYSLSEVLWVCANLFSDVQFKMNHKKIMLFTNEDNPHGNDSVKASWSFAGASLELESVAVHLGPGSMGWSEAYPEGVAWSQSVEAGLAQGSSGMGLDPGSTGAWDH
ncbi:X-ray repair cross-complementing protein 6 [Plecturocebus cupreus]